jgi:hypothetical protein
MRTPAGKECKYFYGDYFRGRHIEECRLVKDADLSWTPRLCETCPVPEILSANSCEHQQLIPELKRSIFFMRPEVKISAYCTKSNQKVNEPRVGCGECHPDLPEFLIALNEPDPAD